MQRLNIRITPDVSVTVENENVLALIRAAAFWSLIPKQCPICGSSLYFTYRTPKDFEYYGVKCTGTPAHETTFGEFKEAGKGLYYKESEPWKQAYQGGGAQQDSAGMITAAQLGMVYHIQAEAGIDVRAECLSLNGTEIEDLTKQGAVGFIDHLQRLSKGGSGVMMATAPANVAPAAQPVAAVQPAPAVAADPANPSVVSQAPMPANAAPVVQPAPAQPTPAVQPAATAPAAPATIKEFHQQNSAAAAASVADDSDIPF